MVQVATETSAEALQVCAVTALAARLAVTPPAATRANTARATTRRRGLRIINCLSASLLTPMRAALTSAPVHICSNPGYIPDRVTGNSRGPQVAQQGPRRLRRHPHSAPVDHRGDGPGLTARSGAAARPGRPWPGAVVADGASGTDSKPDFQKIVEIPGRRPIRVTGANGARRNAPNGTSTAF